MKKLIKQLKQWNRQRVADRRQRKIDDLFNNDFNRSSLTIEALNQITLKKKSILNEQTSRAAVYSTYFGSNHTLTFNKQMVDPNFDHYFISNNLYLLQNVKKLGWIPIHINLPISRNRILSAQQSKIPKALPHIFEELNRYEYLFYRDDKIDFDTSLLPSLIEQMESEKAAFSIRLHPDLSSNVLNEFAVAMHQHRYEAQRSQMVEYISKKVADGYSLKVNNMFWTSAILRHLKHPDTITINEDWYQNILDCGIECQLSFDFVAQKYGCIIEMPQNIS